jgi:anaerobic ribonucleoside-triphosphate reductase
VAEPTLKEQRILKIEEADEQVELRVPCELYSRIVGYIRPVQNWHQGKQQEFSERKTFKIPEQIG